MKKKKVRAKEVYESLEKLLFNQTTFWAFFYRWQMEGLWLFDVSWSVVTDTMKVQKIFGLEGGGWKLMWLALIGFKLYVKVGQLTLNSEWLHFLAILEAGFLVLIFLTYLSKPCYDWTCHIKTFMNKRKNIWPKHQL